MDSDTAVLLLATGALSGLNIVDALSTSALRQQQAAVLEAEYGPGIERVDGSLRTWDIHGTNCLVQDAWREVERLPRGLLHLRTQTHVAIACDQAPVRPS